MKKYSFALIIISLLFLFSCSIFQKDSFEGEWTLKLDGAIKESFDFKILPNNEFNFSKTVSYGYQDYDVTIQGKIEKDGQLKAAIIAGAEVMGEITGMMTFERGGGKWNASILTGEWTAFKK